MYKYECLAEFLCPACNGHAIAEVEIPEPSWDELDGVKRLDSEGPVVVTCPQCKEKFHAYVRATPRSSKIALDDYPETDLHSTVPSFIMTEEAADNGDVHLLQKRVPGKGLCDAVDVQSVEIGGPSEEMGRSPGQKWAEDRVSLVKWRPPMNVGLNGCGPPQPPFLFGLARQTTKAATEYTEYVREM